MPLGVFGLVKGAESDPHYVMQLAVNKSGAVAGNYYDVISGTSVPVQGAVDKQTQRLAWTVGDNKTTVGETGIYNLTKDEAPALIHIGKDKTQQWTLVPAEATATGRQRELTRQSTRLPGLSDISTAMTTVRGPRTRIFGAGLEAALCKPSKPYQTHRETDMDLTRHVRRSGMLSAAAMAIASSANGPEQITGVPGSPSATTTIDGRQLRAPGRSSAASNQAQRRAVEALLAAARRAAQGRAQRAADHDRRCRLRRPQHLRRRDPDAGPRPHRRRTACATPTSTRRRCARRRARR